jgi:cytochrome c553
MGLMNLRYILLAAALLAGAPAFAQDADQGAHNYFSYCVSCHGIPPRGGPELSRGDPQVIRNALNSVGAMQFLRGQVTDPMIVDIAAYIAVLVGAAPPPPSPPAAFVPDFNYTDMWWGGESESGWGFNVIQHASNNIFGIMYTYLASGKRTWYLIPGGRWTSPTTFTGTFYRSSGPPYNAAFKANEVIEVGTATLLFQDFNHATLSFTVDGVPATKTMLRLQF